MSFMQPVRRMSGVMLLFGLACASGEQAAEEETATAAPELPDTTATAVWAYLQEAEYQNWDLWPGTTALYGGNPPHGMLLTTYVNQAAHGAIGGSMSTMPAGAIVVKENYMPDSSLAAVTVMYKVPGFDAEYNDWYWLKRNADGSVDVDGRGAGCQACHSARQANDYLYTSDLVNEN